MNPKRNKSWIAGTLVAACVLAVICFVALHGNNAQTASEHPAYYPQEATAPSQSQEEYTDNAPEEYSTNTSRQSETYAGFECEPGIVLVTLPLGVSPTDAVLAIAEETGIEGVALADKADATAQASTAPETQQHVKITIPGNLPMEEAIARISESSAVDAVQPNFIYYLNDDASNSEKAQSWLIAQNLAAQDLLTQATTANDTYIDKQWALKSIYAYGDTTGVGNAWDEVTTDKKVTVAVIDEGFQADHPDLAGNVVETYNSADKSTDVSEVTGQNGHGTHVAGIVSAVANNETGVAGVSHNAQLLLIKGMDSNGNLNSETLATGMDYARQKKNAYNIRVISMSIGGGTTDTSDWPDDVLIKAIDSATKADIAVVCSAGNAMTSGGTRWTPPYTNYPADYKNAISVINLRQIESDPHDVERNSSSNYNSPETTVDDMNTGKNISAPGTSIYSTYPGSTYRNNSGTSMAAPCVAGVLALLFTVKPDLTAAQATSLLYSTATDIGDEGWDADTGYGEVNAYQAVTNSNAYLSGPTSVQSSKSVTLTGPPLVSNWKSSNANVAAVSDGVVTGVSGGTARISAKLGWMTLYQDVTVYDPSIVGAGSVSMGSTARLSLSGRSISGSWTWTTSDSNIATVNSNGVVTGKKTGTVTITATLSDDPNIYATKTVTITPASISGASITLSTTSYTYDGTAKRPGVSSVRVGSNTLRAGTDYTVTGYWNNTNAGTGTVTIKGSGEYTGTATQTFTINKASLAFATVSPTTYLADGRAKTPTVAVFGPKNGKTGQVLSAASDYTLVSPSGRIKAGTYTYMAIGKGNYTGTATASFKIVNAPSLSGATKVPVGATAAYSVSNGSIAIKSGSNYATLSGNTLTGKKSGTVVLSLRDTAGVERSTKSVSIYSLNGSFIIQSALNSSRVLDISGGSLWNGGNLQIWESNGTAAQKFSFALQSDGCFKISCTHDGKVLDVSGGSKANSANVQQWVWNTTNAQRWRISVDASNKLTFINKGSGKALDVAGARNANGANVQQYQSNDTAAQKWTLVPTTCALGPVLDGVYSLSTKVNTNYALDVSGASGYSGANVQVWHSNGTYAQQWKLEYQGSGYYKATCIASGKALDISGASKSNGANAQQWDWNGTGAQLWKVTRNSDGSFTFTCKASGKVLDVSGGVASNGRNVWQYASNGTNAQKWVLWQY